MRTTKESAADLRAALKANGWNAKKVSVRTNYFSMGSSVDVTIRDASVPMARVKELTKEHCEHIEVDSYGDILSGGNTYVHVGRTSDVDDIVAARYEGAIADAASKLDEEKQSRLVKVEGVKDVMVGFDNGTYFVRVWLGDRPGYSTTKDQLRVLALQVADYVTA